MMLDRNIVAVSPASTWRILSKAGLLDRWNKKISKKGTGFVQPLRPHEHWHVDISYLNICGTFYYLCSLLDGCSRYIVHWEIREQMLESDIEIIIERAKEKFPTARPRIISDNGPQFIAKDFKEFIRLSGMTHVRTSPYYPQSNGKLERFHKTLKGECIRPKTPLSLDDARRLVAEYIEHYHTVRLHSAIGYIAPVDKLNGRENEIFKERDQKLEAAREQRRIKRQLSYQRINSSEGPDCPLTQVA
jgi:transposase InsO family protein